MDTTTPKSKKSKSSTTDKASNKKLNVKDVKPSLEYTDFDEKRCYTTDAWDYINEEGDLRYEY